MHDIQDHVYLKNITDNLLRSVVASIIENEFGLIWLQ